MTIAFREHENVNRAPVYICQDIAVCLDCGHLELSLPPAKLEQLKQEALGPDSRRSFGQEWLRQIPDLEEAHDRLRFRFRGLPLPPYRRNLR